MGELKHFNPFHDKLGRFSSARGGSGSGSVGGRSSSSTSVGKDLKDDLASLGFETDEYGFMEKNISFGSKDDKKQATLLITNLDYTDENTRKKTTDDLNRIEKNISKIDKNAKQALEDLLIQYREWNDLPGVSDDESFRKELRKTFKKQGPYITYMPGYGDGEISYSGGEMYGYHELTITVDFNTGNVMEKEGVQING